MIGVNDFLEREPLYQVSSYLPTTWASAVATDRAYSLSLTTSINLSAFFFFFFFAWVDLTTSSLETSRKTMKIRKYLLRHWSQPRCPKQPNSNGRRPSGGETIFKVHFSLLWKGAKCLCYWVSIWQKKNAHFNQLREVWDLPVPVPDGRNGPEVQWVNKEKENFSSSSVKREDIRLPEEVNPNCTSGYAVEGIILRHKC